MNKHLIRATCVKTHLLRWVRVLKLRVLIALYSDPTLTHKDIAGRRNYEELRQLFGSTSPWVIALGHYLKTIFEYHRDPTLLAIEQIDTAIRLEGQVYITMHEPLVFFVARLLVRTLVRSKS